MNSENKYVITKEKRKKLGDYIKEARLTHLPNKLGLNELAEITGTASSLISNLENGKIQKINPFLLQDIAEGLNIDYKVLYKIVGFLNENGNIPEDKKNEDKKSMVIIWEREKREVIDISSISSKGISELKNYIKYLKIDYKEYNEFLKWKKEQKRNYKINKALDEYMSKCEWDEGSRYQIRYTEETVKELFEKNGLRLNEIGKEFYQKLVNFFGGEEFFDELRDENGNQLTGSKKEYQMGKIVRYYAANVRLDF
ncbi:helix-turn-helix domain-containing protein [Fusobacterium varium]